MPMARRLWLIPLLLTLATFAITGCGGSGDANGSTVEVPNPLGSPQTSGAYYTAVQALSPSLYWRMDEADSSHSLTDVSGHGRHGAYGGDTPDVLFNQTGKVDGDKSVRFPAPSASDDATHWSYGRAYEYQPFTTDSQLTFVAVVRRRVRILRVIWRSSPARARGSIIPLGRFSLPPPGGRVLSLSSRMSWSPRRVGRTARCLSIAGFKWP